MLISKRNRTAIYKFLFSEGVCYAHKDFGIPHPEIKFGEGEEDFVRNLEVIKLMQSLTSRELVTERYAWRHYYWFLTDKGVEYLREYLNIPEDVVPNTLMKTNRTFEKLPPRGAGPRGDRPPRRDDRGGYRCDARAVTHWRGSAPALAPRVPQHQCHVKGCSTRRGALVRALAWPYRQPKASAPAQHGTCATNALPHLQPWHISPPQSPPPTPHTPHACPCHAAPRSIASTPALDASQGCPRRPGQGWCPR